ncbi:hypothetical protein CASFOL_024630 [Castilleja foliolosa]|uniref:Uncharacterized protein n=1 Tax=Castilleja foliolosa TaxID=1961234 RepID=A0ABD3CS02_9LAMI
MARSLANIINKGIFAFPAARSISSKSLYQSIIGFSTHVPNDPDTHQNLPPSNKVENSELTMTDVEKELYKIYIESRDAIECRKRPVGALIDIEREKNERTIAISAPLRYAKLKARLVELSKLKKQRTDELEEIILQEKKVIDSG